MTRLAVYSLLLASLLAGSMRAEEAAPKIPGAITGRSMVVDLQCSAPLAQYFLVVSTSPGPLPTPWGKLGVGLPYVLLATGLTDTNGKAQMSFPVPANPLLKGATLYFAAVYVDSSGPFPRLLVSAGTRLDISGPLCIASCRGGGLGGGLKPQIVFVDLLSMTKITAFQPPSAPGEIAVDLPGYRGYVGQWTSIGILDIPGRRILKTVPTTAKGFLSQMKAAPGGRYFFAMDPGVLSPFGTRPATVVVFDGEQEKVAWSMTLPKPALTLVPTPLFTRFWVITQERIVHLLDWNQGKIIASVNIGRTGDASVMDWVAVGTSLVVSTGTPSNPMRPPTQASLTEVDFLGTARATLTTGLDPYHLVSYRLSSSWRVHAACTYQGATFTPSVRIYGTSNLRSLGQLPGTFAAGASDYAASPLAPLGLLVWSGRPRGGLGGGIPGKNGTLMVIDGSGNRILKTLTTPQATQSDFLGVRNATRNGFAFLKNLNTLRWFDIPTQSFSSKEVALGQAASDLVDV